MFIPAAGAQDASQDGSASPTEPVCGGIGALGSWVNTGAEDSDITASDTPFNTNAEITLVRDSVILFSVGQAAAVRIEAQAVGSGDPEIALFGPTGERILSDDDGGEGVSSRAETDLEPGTYCLVTSNVQDRAMTALVRIGRTEHPPLSVVPSETAVAACAADDIALLHDGPIAALPPEGLSATGSVSQTPAYRLSLGEPQALTIRADGVPADPVLRFYDADGALLGENDDTNGRNAQLDFTTPLQPGDYCIALQALSDDSAQIRVSVVPRSPQATLARLFATGKAAPPPGSDFSFIEMDLSAGRAIADVLLEQDTAGWVRIAVGEPGLVVIDAIGLTDTDPSIVLFDALGRKIMANDDARRGTTDSLIAARVIAGEYLLSVMPHDNSTPGPVRVSAQQFVPAQASDQ